MGEVANVFEEMLLAVESDKIEDFSLVANEKMASMEELESYHGAQNNRRSHLNSQVLITDEIAEESSMPRYLQRFKSRRTKEREQEMENEKAAREKPITSAERKERAKIVRESLTRHDRYIHE